MFGQSSSACSSLLAIRLFWRITGNSRSFPLCLASLTVGIINPPFGIMVGNPSVTNFFSVSYYFFFCIGRARFFFFFYYFVIHWGRTSDSIIVIVIVIIVLGDIIRVVSHVKFRRFCNYSVSIIILFVVIIIRRLFHGTVTTCSTFTIICIIKARRGIPPTITGRFIVIICLTTFVILKGGPVAYGASAWLLFCVVVVVVVVSHCEK